MASAREPGSARRVAREIVLAAAMVSQGQTNENENSAHLLTKIFSTARTEGYARQERQELPLPSKPPYTAHLGNLAFDVSSGDIESFLGECQVTNVRIVEDKLDHKPKGFGYVEFATLDGLKKALTLTETNFMGRNIRISVADPRKSCHPDTLHLAHN